MLCRFLTLNRGVSVATLIEVDGHKFADVRVTVLKQDDKARAKAGISFETANELTGAAIQSPKISKTCSWVLIMAGRSGVGKR
jgi:hypothetical protein